MSCMWSRILSIDILQSCKIHFCDKKFFFYSDFLMHSFAMKMFFATDFAKLVPINVSVFVCRLKQILSKEGRSERECACVCVRTGLKGCESVWACSHESVCGSVCAWEHIWVPHVCVCEWCMCECRKKDRERERESEFLVPQERTNKGRAFNNNGTKFEKDV